MHGGRMSERCLGWKKAVTPPHTSRYTLVGLEQTSESCMLPEFRFPARSVLVLGREKEGLPPEVGRMRESDTVRRPTLAQCLFHTSSPHLHTSLW